MQTVSGYSSLSIPRKALGPAAVAGIAALTVVVTLFATPPDDSNLNRDQVVAYQPADDSLMRIWCFYIGQGDSLLIQYPSKFSKGGEPQELLVDGGPGGNQLVALLKKLYPNVQKGMRATIENAVLTHHDDDHVSGLITLLGTAGFRVQNIFHNGLASWKLGSDIFPGKSFPPSSEAISDSNLARGMARFKNGKAPDIDGNSLVQDKAGLISSTRNFTGVYKDLADAATAAGREVSSFDRSPIDHPGLAATAPMGVKITPLWPPVKPRGYALTLKAIPDWSHTVNGNSVVFRLDYGQFSMLFTGDLNEASEEDLLSTLQAAGREDELHVDVLKIPHHGSNHGVKEFFDAVHPVMSVASMGGKGFLTSWKHPSTAVIGWLGGFDRVYSTYIEEKAFDYAKLKDRKTMVEEKSVLIETDGIRFRIVEVEDPANGIPKVQSVRRGDGTRWINAAEKAK